MGQAESEKLLNEATIFVREMDRDRLSTCFVALLGFYLITFGGLKQNRPREELAERARESLLLIMQRLPPEVSEILLDALTGNGGSCESK